MHASCLTLHEKCILKRFEPTDFTISDLTTMWRITCTWPNLEIEFLSGNLIWLFQKFSRICPDFRLAVFDLFSKTVRIGIRDTIAQGPIFTQGFLSDGLRRTRIFLQFLSGKRLDFFFGGGGCLGSYWNLILMKVLLRNCMAFKFKVPDKALWHSMCS